MISHSPQDLSKVSAEGWRQWLTEGVLGMSGLRGKDLAHRAFEPYASHIGRSREYTWVDELAKFVLALDADARRQFNIAADTSLKAMAPDRLETNWTAVLNLLDLIRSINLPKRSVGLAALADALDATSSPIESGIRSRLAAAALMAASEAEGPDRLDVRPVALKLAKLLVETKEGGALREKIRTRLVRLGVESRELERLGLVGTDPQLRRELDLHRRFTVGTETYAY